jgi:HSP20 family molecular chaperone IbpA
MAEPEQNRDVSTAAPPHAGPAQAVIDETIANIESLYSAVTGRTPPPTDRPYAPIPAEKDPGQHVEEQLARLSKLLGGAGFDGHAAGAWTPRMSVWESDDEILVCLDVPGVTRDDLKVTTRGNLITVTGLRPVPRERQDTGSSPARNRSASSAGRCSCPGAWRPVSPGPS